MASESVSLSGSCDCGRNVYTVFFPSTTAAQESLSLRFDDSSAALQAHSSPSSVFLRTPLSSLQSSTYALFPDESHSQLRRTYESEAAPKAKKIFCGSCGDIIGVWSEDKSEYEDEQDHININWHTLEPGSMDVLETLGVLPEDEEDDVEEEKENEEVLGLVRGTETPSAGVRSMALRSTPWFEEILAGSHLGKMRKRKGAGVSSDGTTRVEWEIVEYLNDEDEDARAAKRVAI